MRLTVGHAKSDRIPDRVHLGHPGGTGILPVSYPGGQDARSTDIEWNRHLACIGHPGGTGILPVSYPGGQDARSTDIR
ncbi:MAG: hypothetical protein F6K65_38750 [Moorea sp. SIO3C2]|nr:hypothetical protein [Moorena sp. SIO3C2]